MTTTARYALPLLDAWQAQKEVTHNEALARIDALIHLAVESRTVAVAPVANIGQCWIVASGAAGVWAGHSGDVAAWDNGGWTFIALGDGCVVFVRDENQFVHRSGSVWATDWPVRSLTIAGRSLFAAAPATIAPPAGGSTIDVEARSTMATLLTALRAAGILAT